LRKQQARRGGLLDFVRYFWQTGERRIDNNMTGFKLATSVGGVGTGERGDRVILDDPHNVIQAESALEREKTVRFFRESMSNRINDDRSAIVIIMQRLRPTKPRAESMDHFRRLLGNGMAWVVVTFRRASTSRRTSAWILLSSSMLK